MVLNFQLWDIRTKGCIYTYKGHNNGINMLRFSPDGRWFASADEEGIIKVSSLASSFFIALDQRTTHSNFRNLL